MHERFAAYLEGLGDTVTAQILDLLAYHYERSANGPKTREYLRRAGAAAAGRYALTEADAYFSRALELTARLRQPLLTPSRTDDRQ